MLSWNKRKKRVALDGRVIELLEGRVLLSVTGSPTQLSPTMIQQAYHLTNLAFTVNGKTIRANGAGQTIAIVDAFGDPNIASDLRTFDANFGLGDNDDAGNFVLTVATPQGSVSQDAGWATEQSLDVEWAHAIAPKADILLVESTSASVNDLTDAVNWAKAQSGVVAVSMSWGSIPDFIGEDSHNGDFVTPAGHQGVTFVAASGDNGQPNFPSTSPDVLAVGGTTLTVDASGNIISESAWSGSGGGHSSTEGTDKPDVAYDGNPSTGFLVYDSIPDGGSAGWHVVGGTSAGAPQWAGMMALVAQGRALQGLGSLDGATQAIPQILALPSGDFNSVSGGGLTGLGSPVGQSVISALVGGGITSVSSSVSSGATTLVFSQQPTDVTAGNKINPAVTVFVDDGNGDLVTSDNSTVTLTASGPGSVTGTLNAPVVNGVATFNNLLLYTAGSYTFTATDGGLTSATSNSFDVDAAAVSQLMFVQQPSNVTAGTAIGPSIMIQLEDQFGNLVSNSSNVVLTVASGLGGLSGTTSASAVDGVASFGNVTITQSGTYTLKAAVGGLAQAISMSFVVSAAAGTKVVFTQPPTGTAAGAVITPSVTVAVEDQFGNVATGDSSFVTLIVGTGPSAFTTPKNAQAVNGVATFGTVALPTAGTYTLQALDGALASATSGSFVVTAPTASQLVFVQQPGSMTAGNAISPAVTVAVEDPFGAVATGSVFSITLAVATGPGALGGIVVGQTVNGVATFSSASLNLAGSYTLAASATGLTNATSNAFTVAPAAASQLVFVQQPTGAAIRNAISPAVSVAVADQFGNVVTNDDSTVKVSVAGATPAVLKGAVNQATVAGIATFSNLAIGKAGSYVLTAIDGSLAVNSAAFVAGTSGTGGTDTGTQLVFSQEANTITAGTATPGAFVVNVEDALGNLATNSKARVTLSLIGGTRGSGIRGTASVAAVGGIATFNNVLVNVAGSYTVMAKSARQASATSNAMLVNPAAPARMVFLQQPTNAIAGSAIGPAVAVELFDRFKNLVTNDDSTVTMSVLSGPVGAAVGGTDSAAVVNGIATFDDIVLSTAGHYRLLATDGAVTFGSKPIMIAPGTAANITFVQQPSDVVAGRAISPRVAVMVTDGFGNAVANGTAVSIGVQSGPVGGSISGLASAVVRKGVATFGSLSFLTAGDYFLVVSVGDVSVVSGMFSVS